MSKKNNFSEDIFPNVVSCFTADDEQKNETYIAKQPNPSVSNEDVKVKLIAKRMVKSAGNEQVDTEAIHENKNELAINKQMNKLTAHKNTTENISNSTEDATAYNYSLDNVEDSTKSLQEFTVPPTPNNSATVPCVKNSNQQEAKENIKNTLSISRIIKVLEELKNNHQSKTEQNTEKKGQLLLNSTDSNEQFLEKKSDDLNMSGDQVE